MCACSSFQKAALPAPCCFRRHVVVGSAFLCRSCCSAAGTGGLRRVRVRVRVRGWGWVRGAGARAGGQVDMTWHGHHHSYQRTCPVVGEKCQGFHSNGAARVLSFLHALGLTPGNLPALDSCACVCDHSDVHKLMPSLRACGDPCSPPFGRCLQRQCIAVCDVLF